MERDERWEETKQRDETEQDYIHLNRLVVGLPMTSFEAHLEHASRGNRNKDVGVSVSAPSAELQARSSMRRYRQGFTRRVDEWNMECQIVLGYYLALDFGKAWELPWLYVRSVWYQTWYWRYSIVNWSRNIALANDAVVIEASFQTPQWYQLKSVLFGISNCHFLVFWRADGWAFDPWRLVRILFKPYATGRRYSEWL
jgi:hypothetical protein